MKILLYVNSHLPQIGGRELVVHNLAIQYKRMGHQVVVGGASGRRRHANLEVGYPVSRWPVLRQAPFLSRQIALAAFALTHRPDIVHAHSTYPCGYSAVKLRKLLNCPVVITPHGEDINVVPEINFGQRLDPVQREKIDYAVQQADATTAISDTIAVSLEVAGAPVERILRIVNGVDLDRFAGDHTGSIREHLQIGAGQPIVVSTGNYHPRKGHEILVEAVAHARRFIPEVALVIVGRTSETFCADVRNRGYGSFVHFAGTLPVPLPGSGAEDLLADLLRASKIYVSSSMDEGAEGLSLALMEAMAASVCPIVTDISGNRDIVKDGLNGLVVPPKSAVALGDAIVRALGDEPLRQRLAEAAKQTVRQFGWDRVAADYIASYRTLIERHRVTRG